MISKNRIFRFLQLFSMLNFFTMMVYAHFVDFIILMFPCIQNLYIEWIKSNIIIFFHLLTLTLSKCQHQFKLTLAVGGYRFCFFQKTLLFPIHKCYEKQLFKFILLALIFYKNFFIRKIFISFLFYLNLIYLLTFKVLTWFILKVDQHLTSV